MDNAPADRSRGQSRRTVLLGAAAVLAAGGAGVGLGLATSGGTTSTPPQPADHEVLTELRAAVAAERDLVASTTAARRAARGSARRLLDEIRQDHVAHLRALEAVLADARHPEATAATAASPGAQESSVGEESSAGAARGRLGRAENHLVESRAASAAAERAMRLSGTPALLLATIAASEAAHAEALR